METTAGSVIAYAQTSEDRDKFLATLPQLSATQLPSGDHCPICLSPFSAILKGCQSSPEKSPGVTRLQCGHIFCMADITSWIHIPRGSCPTCRDIFLVIPEPSDDESSDGGEYIPGSDSITDDMIDGETWTDEDGELWTDGEDMSFDEGITEGETDSLWGRSSEDAMADINEDNLPVAGQLGQPLMDAVTITAAGETICLTVPHDDPGCDQIKTELIQWRTHIDQIQMQDRASNKDETRARIRDGLHALRVLKHRVDAIDPDSSAKESFVHAALVAIEEINSQMESKLEMMHDIDCYFSRREERL